MTVHSYINNTGIENAGNFSGVLAAANASASNALFAGIDIMVFFVLLLSIAATVGSWEIALLTSSFIALILSVLGVYMGVLSITFAGYFVGAIVIITMYVVWNRN